MIHLRRHIPPALAGAFFIAASAKSLGASRSEHIRAYLTESRNACVNR